MPEIRIGSHELADRLKGTAERIRLAQLDACYAAAMHLVAHLKQLSDDLGITYQGVWKNSNKAEKTEDGAVTFNDAPHAGIVEEGCRAHYLPVDVIEGVLTDWVRRKLQLEDKEARSAAYAIANKIAREGMQGRFPYANSLEQAREFFHEEMERVRLS